MQTNKTSGRKTEDKEMTNLPENERIYLNIPDNAADFVKDIGCRLDSKRKIWYTSCQNPFIDVLVRFYEISDMTSESARAVLDSKLMELRNDNDA